jgi:hypothetical protein
MTGDEIKLPSKIVTNYLKGRFTIDILATIPFDSIAEQFTGENISTNRFVMFSCLKLIRILRL